MPDLHEPRAIAATVDPNAAIDTNTSGTLASRPLSSSRLGQNDPMTLSRILPFLLVLLTLAAGLHFYLWARLVRDTSLAAPWRGVATFSLVAFAALTPSMFLARALPRSVTSPILAVLYTWFGVLFFLFVLLVAGDIVRLVASILPRSIDLDPSRRRFLTRGIGAVASVGAFALSGASMFLALGPVAIKRVRVSLAKLPRALSGYSIVQLTDVHVGPTIGRDFIEHIVAQANAQNPDMVVITGDLVDGSVDELKELVAPLAKLRARDGVFFITGNHEYYSGVDEWLAFLPSLGIRVLHNERVRIRGAEGFDLAGVDDASAARFGDGHGMDLDRALGGRDESRALVLLAHQPKQVRAAAPYGVDLQISGHTHGGQLFPFMYLVGLDQPYVAGLHKHGQTNIYVSRGTGYWGPPMRLGAPAEITRIELVAA